MVLAAIQPVIERVSAGIAQNIGELVAAQLERELSKMGSPRSAGAKARAPRAAVRRKPAELTKWVADRSARRVPKFVIEMTGLDTKKKIVARYGENAAFEVGKPLPPEASRSAGEQNPDVKAKPPVVRKKGRAAA